MGRFAFALDNVVTTKNTVAAGIGVVLAQWIHLLYGEGEGRFEVACGLLAIIGLDWICGIAAAHKTGEYTSEYGLNGVLRTLFIVAFPAVATLLDQALGTGSTLFFGVSFGLIYHTWQSMTANAYRAGWEKWIPDVAIKLVESEIKNKTKRYSKGE